MKIIYVLFISLLSCGFAYSQGDIIERSYKSGNDYKLKIINVSKDSITYKSFGETTILPLSAVIAYRLDSKDEFIFPDSADKEIYAIRNNKAINKGETLKEKDKDAYIIKLLKKYQLPQDAYQKKSLSHKISLYTKDSSKLIKANPRKQLYVVLKNDPLTMELKGKIFKITNDSILYMAFKLEKDTIFYAINKSDIRYIGVESQKSFTGRMILGSFSLLLVPALPCIMIPIHIFSHPSIERYDIENKWKLRLSEKL